MSLNLNIASRIFQTENQPLCCRKPHIKLALNFEQKSVPTNLKIRYLYKKNVFTVHLLLKSS